ncbi:potassium channel family protein [Carboxydothermus pertinax]|uniref:Potassium transporter Trk n=1 Tax=Carboxydothermus pertinax TaxID=870242 RepID=A0A1L8CUP2_9THEO|nr:TrkA family potassium uptake protein [Carboxydothermus pertinax]GAV22646.1 potassium transporter Trk [Carboxydothermus pertinax]
MESKQFGVIGLGRFGSSVAKTLSELGYEVLAVDSSEERVEEIKDYVTHAVCADATDEHTLKAVGIRNCDEVVVAIGQEMQNSILITLMLKEMGIKKVWAKAQNDLHGKILSKVGADHVIYPEKEMGIKVANKMVANNILEFIELSEEYSILEISIPPRYLGKTIKEIDVRAKYGFTILAIKRGNQLLISPSSDEQFQTGDILVLIGRNENFKKLERDIGD